MGFLDWLALSFGLATIVGGSIEPGDFDRELNQSTPAQIAAARPATSGVSMGGELVFRFADSGVHAAEDRATEARESLRRVVVTFDLPKTYFGPALRVTGGDVAEIHYYDVKVTQTTMADAKAVGAANATALAERWRADLDRQFKRLPVPLTDGWIASEGRTRGTVLVSDATLARAAAACVDPRPGRAVSVKAADGVVILEGKVATSKEKVQLARLMKELPGCRAVDDRLSVGQ